MINSSIKVSTPLVYFC